MEHLQKNKILLALLLLFVSIVCIVFWRSGEHNANKPQEEFEELTTVTSEEIQELTVEQKEKDMLIMVDVKGAVKTPGVYQISSGGRAFHAIEAAGGLHEAADDKFINLAQKLEDGSVLYVPAIGEMHGLPPLWGQEAESAGEEKKTVNINAASQEELQSLTGIGPAKAGAIIQYREEHGGFVSIEDIKKVSGIGEKSFEKLKENIAVK
ncbi:helix-hairpin-helix domain-containing protein [Metabacillus lacus]|nr:helix-hairpin-helix domain-containing protein [Metabacillus lacus]